MIYQFFNVIGTLNIASVHLYECVINNSRLIAQPSGELSERQGA